MATVLWRSQRTSAIRAGGSPRVLDELLSAHRHVVESVGRERDGLAPLAIGRCPPRSGSSSSRTIPTTRIRTRSEEHTSELQSRFDLVCRLLLEKKKNDDTRIELVLHRHASNLQHPRPDPPVHW